MPWNDQSGGPQGGGDRGQGPWGGRDGRQPWGGGQPPRPPSEPEGPDLDELFRRWGAALRGRVGGRGGGGAAGASGPGLSAPLIAGVIGFVWLASGVFVVNQGEAGVVTRFGAYVETRPPGLHWHLPFPMESARVENVATQRRVTVGERSDRNQPGNLMITGDRNVVDVQFVVVYRLSDARQWLFEVRDQEDTVRGVAESAMREIIGGRELQRIITTDRAAIEQAAETQVQTVLNGYRAGVQILQVELLRAAPPPRIQDAFNDVVRAGQDAETARNQATQYANEVVPRARGEAAQITQAAQGYRERVVREANGEAQRFALVEQQYRAAPQVTRQRLYLETMERIYRSAETIIIDRQSGAIPFVPIDQFRRQQPGAAAPAAPATPAPSAQPQGGAR